MWMEIYFLSSKKIKLRLVRFRTPNFISHSLCTLYIRVCIASQHLHIHRRAEANGFIACVEMSRPAAARKVCCSSPLVSLSITAWATGPVYFNIHTHTHTVSAALILNLAVM